MSIDNSELIVKKHDLKLKIQKHIMENKNEIANSQDIGYTSWVIANAVLDEIKEEKSHPQKINKLLNFFIDKGKIKL